MTADELFSLSMDMAAVTIKSGGEIHRAEETVRRINGDCHVFALPSLIIAQRNGKTQIRRIYGEEINLALLAEINAKSRRLCGESSADKSYEAYRSSVIDAVCNFGATASFALFFGGSLIDALFAGIIGVFITFGRYKQISFESFSSNLIDSFIAGVLSFVPVICGIDVNRDKIIIGTVMLLVPGLTVVNAIRDMMNSDLVAGMLELLGAIMSALSIALGIAGAYAVLSRI